MKYLNCLLITIVLLCSGCAMPVFKSRMSLSSKSVVQENFTPIKRVSTTKTNYYIVLLPFMHDTRMGYNDLLQASKKCGGDSVIDMQVTCAPSFYLMFPPILVQDIEYSGTAVKLKH